MGNLLLEIQNYYAINYKIVILRVELDLDTDLDAMGTRSNRERSVSFHSSIKAVSCMQTFPA